MHTGMFTVFGLEGFPEVRGGDALAPAIVQRALVSCGGVADGDIVVVASKVVSIAERRRVELAGVHVTDEATQLAARIGKDPRLVALILGESTSHFLAGDRGPIIARHRLGLQLTSAGVDRDGSSAAYILPEDPDRSARAIADELTALTGVLRLGVVIADSDGRPDRGGATVIAIGCAGIAPLRRTSVVLDGKEKTQDETLVDLIAGAAGIVIGQRGRGVPVAILRGVAFAPSDQGVRSILHD